MPAIRPFALPPRLRSMLERADAGIAEPFRGVTDGGSVAGLFPLSKTGISLAPLVEAARSWLATLTAAQSKAASFAIDDEAWRMWSNIHPWLMRHGVCLADLGQDQRAAADLAGDQLAVSDQAVDGITAEPQGQHGLGDAIGNNGWWLHLGVLTQRSINRSATQDPPRRATRLFVQSPSAVK